MNMDQKLMNETSIVRSDSVLSSELQDEVVMMDIEDGVYFSLKGPTARVWELLEDKTTIGAIRDTLVSEYEVPVKQCEQELINLIHDLDGRGLVELDGVG